ncbi:hypothetical protein KSAC_32770 (plasmid) [Komagataeibacter saccharivorans]|nr:hypothetical protein KSAC_32770 [Komagataeibacter saccharivorans]
MRPPAAPICWARLRWVKALTPYPPVYDVVFALIIALPRPSTKAAAVGRMMRVARCSFTSDATPVSAVLGETA